MCAYVVYNKQFVYPYTHSQLHPSHMIDNTRFQYIDYEILHMSYREKFYYICGTIISIILIMAIIFDLTSKNYSNNNY